MATKHKDPAPSGNIKDTKRPALPMSSGSTHRIRPRAPSPSDHAKTHGPSKPSTMTGDQLSTKHVPNYLKPTVSSKIDASKPAVGKKQHSMHDDMHKANPTAVRRRSFDKPVPVVSQVIHKARVVGNSSLKTNASSTSSSERVSKVVKAVKSQPPLVKTKSLPKGFASSKKEAAKTTTMNKAFEETPNLVVTSETEEEESLDVNVEEELARMESPGEPHDLIQPPLEKHLEHDVVDDENHSSDDLANQEKHNSADDHEKHDEQDPHEPAADEDNVNVSNEETGEVQQSQNIDEINQQTNEAAATEDGDDTEKEKEEDLIKNADAGVGLTAVKTSVDEGEEGKLSAKSEAVISVVHKRQIGGPINKKESPAYNDVIEETASKLVEKRVNKVRALAGAFETVISLEQPHSS